MVTMRVHIMHDISFTYSLGRYLPIENINKFNMVEEYIFFTFISHSMNVGGKRRFISICFEDKFKLIKKKYSLT